MEKCENKIFIHPGQFHFSDSICHIHTILGSCIAITLWHPQKRIGGMCHFVLPQRTGNDKSPKPNGRYGDEAMEMFRNQTSARGTKLSDYQSKVFGGSNVIGNAEQDSVGTRNAELAIEQLLNANIEILVVHVGEFGHRRIVFDIETGDVWVRHENSLGHRMQSTSGKS